MNKDFITDFSSSLVNHGLVIEGKKYDVAVSPIKADDDKLSFSVWCRKRTDREAKLVEYKIADLPAKPTVIATLAALEKIIND